MEMIVIRSRVSRPLSFMLPHRPCCIARGICKCHSGIPPSAQIVQPRGTVTVDVSALKAPDVIAAIRRKDIDIVRLQEPAKPESRRRRGVKRTTAPADAPGGSDVN